MTRNAFTRLAAATLLATATAGLAAPADAAGGYTPEQVCGSGFNTVALGRMPVTDQTNTLRGHAYLLYSPYTGEHCVVTIKSDFVGTPTMTTATLLVQSVAFTGPRKEEDLGNFKYYAGPVKVNARGRCVSFKGMISSPGSGFRAWGGWSGYGDCDRQASRQRGLR
ncbi:hypothetical protein [Nonomuraea sp. NEAU-A123]|uniref:hypothetical protein n=1 Tax=Nonomuraea sp. NEAU-A123 TaxID=2839649 RepID=UPI001BE4339F|nr:hypothetical protein [Nonomuraea sp. NEAU-A123]MBT2232151.1 hypothetical protein [Nonomuraea sp. NEAU-A123]